MLCLTRMIGEKINIGDDIEVTVVRIEPGRVRLAIAAPPNVKILRSELLPDGAAMPSHGDSLFRYFRCLKCPESFLTRHDRDKHHCQAAGV